MRKLNPFLLIAALWEIFRFVLLFLLIVSLFVSRSGDRGEAAHWLLFYGAGSLLMPAALVLMLFDPVRYGAALRLVRLGKALQIVPAVLLILTELATGRGGLFASGGLLPLAVTNLVDMVFLGILLSLRAEPR